MKPSTLETDYENFSAIARLLEKKNSKSESDSDFEFNRVDNNAFDVSFVCLLIPRFHNHLLIGDLVSYLGLWMQNVCVSYAWKLEYIDIHPSYLHWIMSVSMTDSPARFIKIIRRYLSSQVFEEFPRFKKDNQSHDFWAAPNLILAGRQPHPEPMIEEFIRITREEQGLWFWRNHKQ